MVVNLIINSPRPFTRPGRFDSVTSPLTYDPAGITTFPSIITGNKVSKYTGSPGRALRVDTALCSTSGMCVPAGTIILAVDATTGTAAAAGAPGAAGAPEAPAVVFAAFAAGAGAAEPLAVAPPSAGGAGAAPPPEAGAPPDPSCGFCATPGWFAGAGAGAAAEAGGGGGIGPVSCARAGTAHPAAITNSTDCSE